MRIVRYLSGKLQHGVDTICTLPGGTSKICFSESKWNVALTLKQFYFDNLGILRIKWLEVFSVVRQNTIYGTFENDFLLSWHKTQNIHSLET